MTIQILAAVFILFVLARTLGKYKKRLISWRLTIFWFCFWIAAGILFWLPALSDRLAAFLEVGRGADAITYIAFVLLFYLVCKIFLRFESLERQLTD